MRLQVEKFSYGERINVYYVDPCPLCGGKHRILRLFTSVCEAYYCTFMQMRYLVPSLKPACAECYSKIWCLGFPRAERVVELTVSGPLEFDSLDF